MKTLYLGENGAKPIQNLLISDANLDYTSKDGSF
jgi:hypothetical protein